MNLKQRLIELAETHGRKSLYPYIIGNIRSIVAGSYSADQKVLEINETLIVLDQVKDDNSLPWDAKKTPVSAGAEKGKSHLNCIMDVSRIESLVEFPLIELGPMCKECQCFKCSQLGSCRILPPSNLHSCQNVCKGLLAPMNNCKDAKENSHDSTNAQ